MGFLDNFGGGPTLSACHAYQGSLLKKEVPMKLLFMQTDCYQSPLAFIFCLIVVLVFDAWYVCTRGTVNL